MEKEYEIPAGTRIGHVHLKVADMNRSLDFYCGLLGFGITLRYGDQAAFLAAGGYHHHIGLNTWHSRDRPREQWPKKPDGSLEMYSRPLHTGDLLEG